MALKRRSDYFGRLTQLNDEKNCKEAEREPSSVGNALLHTVGPQGHEDKTKDEGNCRGEKERGGAGG